VEERVLRMGLDIDVMEVAQVGDDALGRARPVLDKQTRAVILRRS